MENLIVIIIIFIAIVFVILKLKSVFKGESGCCSKKNGCGNCISNDGLKCSDKIEKNIKE